MSSASAIFSEDRRFRYLLTRQWDAAKPCVGFCMLNPSIADEEKLDPTLTRCKGYAERLGYGGMMIVNAFPMVATNPKVFLAKWIEIGAGRRAAELGQNDRYIRVALKADQMIVGWGQHLDHKALRSRYWELASLFHGRTLHCFGVTKSRDPKHPLYLRGDADLITYALG